jgi:nucleoside-diphosphate-sugar epimerase
VRSWIDADLICQGELKDPDLMMTILRAATIVCDGGRFLLSPPLSDPSMSPGYNPMISVIADRDVARALLLALHGDHAGIYNISGSDDFPRSELLSPISRLGPFPIPRLLSGALSLIDGLWGSADRVLTRYGVVLDTRLAAEKLGFEPLYRIEVRGRGQDRRIDTVRCR